MKKYKNKYKNHIKGDVIGKNRRDKKGGKTQLPNDSLYSSGIHF